VGEWCGCPGRQSGSSGKMKRKGKKSDFLRLTNFKLLSEMKGNSIKARNFKVGNFCQGDHCNDPPRAPSSPAAPATSLQTCDSVTALPYSADTMPSCCSCRNTIPSRINRPHLTLHAADHPQRVLLRLTAVVLTTMPTVSHCSFRAL